MRNSVGKNARIDTFEPIYLFLNYSKPRVLDAEDRNDQSAAARKSQFSHRRQRTSLDAAPEFGKDSCLLEHIYQKDRTSFTHFPFCLSVMTRTSQERRLNRHRTNSCEQTAVNEELVDELSRGREAQESKSVPIHLTFCQFKQQDVTFPTRCKED